MPGIVLGDESHVGLVNPSSPSVTGGRVTRSLIRRAHNFAPCRSIYLRAHPNIEHVWFDYTCLPQDVDGQRSEADRVAFGRMLKNMNLVFLTMDVLVLVDWTYGSRFWTCFELWLSHMTPTPTGLVPVAAE